MKKPPHDPDGFTWDLDAHAVTMSHSEHRCPFCKTKLLRGAWRYYCHPCGVWWWASRFDTPEIDPVRVNR